MSSYAAVLTLFVAAGDPNDWSAFPSGTPAPAPAPSPPARTSSNVPDGALPRYRDAVALISTGRYQQATALLNQLTAEYPQVAELYASRCSAQLGLKQPSYAEADCAYALRLKHIPTALYGLAAAEEQQGKREQAARHFREYQSDPGARSDLRDDARKRADALVSAGGGAPTSSPPSPAQPRPSAKAECKTGKNGRQACGYNCAMGSDGVAACPDTPDGSCTAGLDGHVSCTQLAVRGGANAGGQVPECKTGSDGVQVCGYHCKRGTNGRFFCATTPDAECTANPDGTFSCP